MRLHLRDLLKSPFGIAAIAGVFDLTGGLISTVSDIFWLIFDTTIKSSEMLTHPVAYGSILGGLIIAAIHMGLGLTFTILCYRRYRDTGLESHERKLVIEHLKNKKCVKNLNKLLSK